MINVFREISKDITSSMTKPSEESKYSRGITPIEELNKKKKYNVIVKLRKLKNDDFQMLVFFEEKDELKLVYATKKGDLKLTTEEVTTIGWNKPNKQVTAIRFVNRNAQLRFSNWCCKFKIYQHILDKSSEIRYSNEYLQTIC